MCVCVRVRVCVCVEASPIVRVSSELINSPLVVSASLVIKEQYNWILAPSQSSLSVCVCVCVCSYVRNALGFLAAALTCQEIRLVFVCPVIKEGL